MDPLSESKIALTAQISSALGFANWTFGLYSAGVSVWKGRQIKRVDQQLALLQNKLKTEYPLEIQRLFSWCVAPMIASWTKGRYCSDNLKQLLTKTQQLDAKKLELGDKRSLTGIIFRTIGLDLVNTFVTLGVIGYIALNDEAFKAQFAQQGPRP